MLCKWCGGDAKPETTCPKSLPCPRCKVEAGRSCVRPSGHRAHQLHTQRFEFAEWLDRTDQVKRRRHTVYAQELLDAVYEDDGLQPRPYGYVPPNLFVRQ